MAIPNTSISTGALSGMNQTPAGERVRIAFFGRRNVGKSSLVNAFTGQALSIVSHVKGTTTDPVHKAMELLPLGPVEVIDTPGLDDEGALGEQRVARTRRVMNSVDLAVVVADDAGLTDLERDLLTHLKKRGVPRLLVYNKSDLLDQVPPDTQAALWVSAATGANLAALRERVAQLAARPEPEHPLVADLIGPGKVVVLVIPIDAAAPKGRLILPQQQVIRDALEAGAVPLACQPEKLTAALATLKASPQLVITDSQAFAQVSNLVPEDVPLTSFSILMARYKGSLSQAVAGATVVDCLHNGDRVLISESCTHHRQCGDIGTVKLPGWIGRHTGVRPEFCFTSGLDFPDDLSNFRLVVHCGGCTLHPREMGRRLAAAREQGVPMTNYGILIAYLNGILPRTLAPFPEMARILPLR